MEDNKTITKILEEVAAKICDDYCKYPYQFDSEEELYKVCETCPLERL